MGQRRENFDVYQHKRPRDYYFSVCDALSC